MRYLALPDGRYGPNLLAFGEPDRLYYLINNVLYDRDYPSETIRHAYTIPQPYAYGIAVSPARR